MTDFEVLATDEDAFAALQELTREFTDDGLALVCLTLISTVERLEKQVEAQQKQIDTLLSLFSTHRHGYRWEPTGKDGVPLGGTDG